MQGPAFPGGLRKGASRPGCYVLAAAQHHVCILYPPLHCPVVELRKPFAVHVEDYLHPRVQRPYYWYELREVVDMHDVEAALFEVQGEPCPVPRVVKRRAEKGFFEAVKRLEPARKPS